MGGIHEWLENNRQPPLTDGQIAGAFWRLTTAYENVVAKHARGIYRIHPAWDGKPLDQQKLKPPNQQRQEDDTDYGIKAREEADEKKKSQKKKPIIHCYGLYWHRDQSGLDVAGQSRTGMLGLSTEVEGEIVDFAKQQGVYILYNWPNITYVGRTTSSLYERLIDHAKNPRRAYEWDRFSWFGLCPVDENGDLAAPHPSLDMSDIVAAFETLLITTLSPPFNSKQGDRLGTRYLQVPDSTVEDREREKLVDQMRKLWASARFG